MAKRRKRKNGVLYEGQKIQNFSELKVGDYVVHENHGLGIYQGIEKIEIDKVTKDYMKISYAGWRKSIYSGDTVRFNPKIRRSRRKEA